MVLPFLLFPGTSIARNVGTSAHLLHYSQHEIVTLQSFAEDELIPHEKLQEMKMLVLQFLFLSHL